MTWNQDPVLLHINFITIRWYGLFFALGIFLAFTLTKKLNQLSPSKSLNIDSLFNYVFFGTIIGARLGHCLFYDFTYYLHYPIKILAIWEGGLASHGALIGILTSIYLFSKKYKIHFLQIADLLAAPACIAGSLIRLGNFFNSEIIGNKTTLPWAITFSRIDNFSRHPTQLYESLFYFILGLGLLRKIYGPKDEVKLGMTLGTYLIATFSFRFLVEFIKIPQVQFENTMILNMGQILSIPLIAIGIYLVSPWKKEKLQSR